MELSVNALRAASVVARTVPRPVAGGVARALSGGVARLSADQRLIVERNLRRALPEGTSDAEIRRRVPAVFESYARYWLDSLRLPGMSARDVGRGFTEEGFDAVEETIAQGVGPILALPHLGGWEWAASWLHVVRGWQVAAVVEVLEPPELYEWFLEFRRSLGMHVIPLGSSAGSESAAALAAGEIMCLLCDRDLSGTGIPVEFFGETTRLPGGPALMALRSGSPLHPTAVYFEGARCHAVVLPALDTERHGKLRDDVHRVTQDLADALEDLIRRAPEQWHLLQPNWPSDYAALGLPVPGADGSDDADGAARPA